MSDLENLKLTQEETKNISDALENLGMSNKKSDLHTTENNLETKKIQKKYKQTDITKNTDFKAAGQHSDTINKDFTYWWNKLNFWIENSGTVPLTQKIFFYKI